MSNDYALIRSLVLKNFTKFEDLSLNFSPKINVIIGENGTGKTQLLKTIYSLESALEDKERMAVKEAVELNYIITQKLLSVFLPLDNKLGKLRMAGVGNQHAEVQVVLSNDEKFGIRFNANSQFVALHEPHYHIGAGNKPVFIPTKEVLSFMKGFTSLYEKYGLSFDQTYYDICVSLDLPEMRFENVSEKSKWVIEEIEKVCGGRFVFNGGGNVTFKSGDVEYSANVVAEGFRKIGMLSRLLTTGAIRPGRGGALLWDEPETNMNPKLMKLLVEILLELSRNGQQIIIATHDYVLLKWFDLLMDKGKEDHISFHTLYRDEESGRVLVNSTDNYLDIDPNPIDETYALMADREIAMEMGSLGK